MLPMTAMATAVMPILLIVANVFGAGMILPQVNRLRLARTLDGVSATWVGVGIAMNLWWIAYALPNELWGLLPVSSIAAGLYLVMAWYVVTIAGAAGLRPLMIGLCLFGSVPLIALVVGGLPGAGLAIGLSYGAQFAPAAATAVRAVGTAGISGTTWTMGLVEALIWLLYGVTLRDWALVIGGGGSTLMAAVIVIRLALDPGRRNDHFGAVLVRST